MLLTTSSVAFYHLKNCRIRIELVLVKSNVLSEVQRSMLDGGLCVEDLPIDPSRPVSSYPHLGQSRLTPESLERLKEASWHWWSCWTWAFHLSKHLSGSHCVIGVLISKKKTTNPNQYRQSGKILTLGIHLCECSTASTSVGHDTMANSTSN